jgi:HSP20 family protein
MSAQRPRPTSQLDEAGLIEVLFYGAPSPRSVRHGRVWVPPTDVYETEDMLVALVELAGVRQSDFTVSLFERRLVISGVRVDHGPVRRAYHQMEVPFGEFRTEVELPVAVEASKVDAEYADGFLRILLPKLKAQSITVQE